MQLQLAPRTSSPDVLQIPRETRGAGVRQRHCGRQRRRQRRHTTTDKEGRYRVDFLADVTHDVYISDNAHGYAKFTGIAVDRSDANFQFGKGSDPRAGKVAD